MDYQIYGEIAQYARLTFAPGESIWASSGALMGYSAGVQWRLRVPGGAGGATQRVLAGEGIALTYIETDQPDQYALLSSREPGHIIAWDLQENGPVLTTRGAFLAAWGQDIHINVSIARRAGAALFGGAGLFLQHVSGKGTVLVHGSGDFAERQLAEGEQMLVSSGNLAAFAANVDYDIRRSGGCSKMLFSGEGLFMTSMTGPGRVLLQSLERQTATKSA